MNAAFLADDFARALAIKMDGRNLRDAADEINQAVGSMSPSTLSRVVNRKMRPDMETLLILCDWLHVSPAVFFDTPKPVDTAEAVRVLLTADRRLSEKTVCSFVHLLRNALHEKDNENAL